MSKRELIDKYKAEAEENQKVADLYKAQEEHGAPIKPFLHSAHYEAMAMMAARHAKDLELNLK